MDKQLNRLKREYEKKIPTSFTEEDKQKVIAKIAYKLPIKSNVYRCLVPKIAAGITMILLTLIIVSFQLVDFNAYMLSSQVSVAEPKKPIAEELTVGGRINLKEYPSNYHLYMSHSMSAAIENHEGDLFTNEETLTSLKRLKKEIDKIKFGEEKRVEFQEVIHFTKQALEEDYRDAELLKEIHISLHDLNKYYNKQRFIDDK